MTLKKLLYLFLIPTFVFSLSSCDDDDDDIVGVWFYEGIDHVLVSTSNPLVTDVINDYIYWYNDAEFQGQSLEFDYDVLNVYYDGLFDISYQYSYANGRLTTYWKNTSTTTDFRIRGNSALMERDFRYLFCNDYGEVDMNAIFMLIDYYPDRLGHLTVADIQNLRIFDIRSFSRYAR